MKKNKKYYNILLPSIEGVYQKYLLRQTWHFQTREDTENMINDDLLKWYSLKVSGIVAKAITRRLFETPSQSFEYLLLVERNRVVFKDYKDLTHYFDELNERKLLYKREEKKFTEFCARDPQIFENTYGYLYT